jgi:hypothetical protein
MLPLKNLLNTIPWDSMILVVDNARSPEHAVSFTKRRKLLVQQRAFSFDSSIGKNKTGIPPEHVDGNRSSLPQTSRRGRKSSPLRRRSFVEIEETVGASSAPVRIPVRHRSPSPSKETNDREISAISVSSSLLPKKSVRGRKPTPMRRRSFHEIGETVGASSNSMRIPVRYRNPSSSKETTNREISAISVSSCLLPKKSVRGRKSTPLRRRSVHEIGETVGASSTPVRIPVRHRIPSPSKKISNSKRSVVIHEKRKVVKTNMTVKMLCKMDMSGSNQPIRIRVRRLNPKKSHNSANLVKLFMNMTTDELLTKALEETK